MEQRLLTRGTTMGLASGDWFTLRDLLYGLMLPSGNDAATVIAYHFAGSDRAFADLMNQRLCQLGLTDSTFINPSGLGRGEYNMASAFDLAQVARTAMEYPTFRELAAARSWVANGSRSLWMRNLNDLLGAYPGADGVKIGWTPGAGNTIVASATRSGHRVIVALLHTPNRAGESAVLLDWAFTTFAWSR
jgi:serine-type D-Ala-D-Ala carboxypeptidase (penicillin-binding protein 5/6)